MPPNVDVVRITPFGHLDHLRGPVDGEDAAAVEPLADQ